MKKEYFGIDGIPAVIYGEKSERVWLFVHGQGGNMEEAGDFADTAVPLGYQVLGIDLPEHGRRKNVPGFVPWRASEDIRRTARYIKEQWNVFSLRANSIGAYFSMLALKDLPAEKALLVSPVVDMERLIRDMMSWAGVSEERLRAEGKIETDFGQTLSWDYLRWVMEHPLPRWNTPTAVLYAGGDTLISRDSVEAFVSRNNARLTVYEPGEHWFHTPPQLEALHTWERENI